MSKVCRAVVDGLKGFPEAITSVFLKTVVQTCIVHLMMATTALHITLACRRSDRLAQTPPIANDRPAAVTF